MPDINFWFNTYKYIGDVVKGNNKLIDIKYIYEYQTYTGVTITIFKGIV